MTNELIERLEAGTVPALSIRQPWCHRILFEGKDIENRDWRTHGRGWFLIHASKKYDGAVPTAHRDIPKGGIVGAAKIVDCVDQSDSEWFMGKFGFVLECAIPIDLIPCNGKLGFFKPDPEIITAVIAALSQPTEARKVIEALKWALDNVDGVKSFDPDFEEELAKANKALTAAQAYIKGEK